MRGRQHGKLTFPPSLDVTAVFIVHCGVPDGTKPDTNNYANDRIFYDSDVQFNKCARHDLNLTCHFGLITFSLYISAFVEIMKAWVTVPPVNFNTNHVVYALGRRSWCKANIF